MIKSLQPCVAMATVQCLKQQSYDNNIVSTTSLSQSHAYTVTRCSSGSMGLFAQSKASSHPIVTAADIWSRTCIWCEQQGADILHNAGNPMYCSSPVTQELKYVSNRCGSAVCERPHNYGSTRAAATSRPGKRVD